MFILLAPRNAGSLEGRRLRPAPKPSAGFDFPLLLIGLFLRPKDGRSGGLCGALQRLAQVDWNLRGGTGRKTNRRIRTCSGRSSDRPIVRPPLHFTESVA